MNDSKIKNFPVSKMSTDKEASRRLAEMMELLDQLEAAERTGTPESEGDTGNWPPLDRYGQPMRIGISTGDSIIPLVESEADWDRATVEREDLFERRFGFAWPHRYRKELLRLKHERELTDREVKLLHTTGNLHRHRTGVRLSSNGFIALMGCLFIAAMTVMFLMLALRVTMTLSLTWPQVAGVVVFSLFLLGVSWASHQFYIQPWRIVRREPL